MQFALFIPHAPPPVVSHLAHMAEASGFYGICTDDHMISPFSDMTPDFQGCYESFTLMSYLAGQTRKVKLSHMALVPSLRGPVQTAKMAATLDQLSGGRMILAIGAGWYAHEFKAMDLPFDKHAVRIQREREIIQILKALWTQDEVDFKGAFYTLRQASIHPLPVQKPHPPLWVSGDSKPSQRLAAELGDGWLMHGHAPLQAEKLIKKIETALAKPRDEFTMATACFVLMGENKKQADAKLKTIPQETWRDFMKARIRDEIRNRLAGTAADIISRIREYESAGIEHMNLVFLDPADLESFTSQVLPVFRQP